MRMLWSRCGLFALASLPAMHPTQHQHQHQHHRDSHKPLLRSEAPQLALTRVRGGGDGAVQAQLQLLLAGATWGTFPVMVHLIDRAGTQPLPAVLNIALRYQILAGIALIAQTWQRQAARPAAKTQAPSGLIAASLELAAYAVMSTFLAIWGVKQLSAATSELLAGTTQVFVPPLMVLLGCSSPGPRAWAGSVLAFAATAAVGSSAHAATESRPLAGQAAMVASSLGYALGRVRAQSLVKRHAPERLQNTRAFCMGLLAMLPLCVSAFASSATRASLSRVGEISPTQWGLLVELFAAPASPQDVAHALFAVLRLRRPRLLRTSHPPSSTERSASYPPPRLRRSSPCNRSSRLPGPGYCCVRLRTRGLGRQRPS